MEARGNGPYSSNPVINSGFADVKLSVKLTDQAFQQASHNLVSDNYYYGYYDYYSYYPYQYPSYYYPDRGYGYGYYELGSSYGTVYTTDKTDGRQLLTAGITINGTQLYTQSKYANNGDIIDFEWANIKVGQGSFGVNASVNSDKGLNDSRTLGGTVNSTASNNSQQANDGYLQTSNPNTGQVLTSTSSISNSNSNVSGSVSNSQGFKQQPNNHIS